MSRFRPMVSRRAPSASSFAEMFLAPGPQAIGQTGDNSYQTLFGRDWLLLWGRDDDVLRLYQEQGGAWVEVVDELPPVFGSPAPAGSRRWSVAFDQSARVIVAYEDAEGIVRVTRWDPALNQYVQNVSFAGSDPCVVMDASWSLDIPSSDVLLFYLSSDRERVCARVQRDVYAVEREIHDYGEPVILDRVVALPIRYQVLVSDALGDPLPDMLVSDPYPYLAYDSMGAAATGPSAGAYVQVVIPSELADTLTVGATGPAGGAYGYPLISFHLGEGVDATATGPAGGAYEEATFNHLLNDSLDAAAVGPTAGAYLLAVLETSLDGEGINVTASGPSGGTYS